MPTVFSPYPHRLLHYHRYLLQYSVRVVAIQDVATMDGKEFGAAEVSMPASVAQQPDTTVAPPAVSDPTQAN